MAKKKLLVPVALKRGGIFHDTDYARGANSREEAAEINAGISRPAYYVDYVWEEVEPFTASLKFMSFERSGHPYALWQTKDGSRYPMFLVDMENFLQSVNFTNGWSDNAIFEVVKRGTAYGIKLV